ncbi:MAG: lysine--tRNA ligase [Candidatus Saccharimonadales bacterium]
MNWLNKIVDEAIKQHPSGEILVSSGVSPSGTYHLGTLREVMTAEAIMWAIKQKGRQSRHVHVVDDLDVFRKVPLDVPAEFEKYLGWPLCDVPSPDEKGTYADYYLKDLLDAAQELKLEMEVLRSHEKYRQGFFVPAIETALDNETEIKRILEEVSGRKLDKQFSPIQVVEGNYIKNRQFVSINKTSKEITYLDDKGNQNTQKYDDGKVKLNWRIDWPARWSLLGVNVEPFGRDHATKGGSYDTGKVIVENVYQGQAPIPVPYNFINKTGETKKMSKSKGDAITAAALLRMLPPELVWYFLLRYSPDKLLFFDEGSTFIKLYDDYKELLSKSDKTEDEQTLLNICLHGNEKSLISRIPFSHLVASFQASLRDTGKTIDVIKRTEHSQVAVEDSALIHRELNFIKNWLDTNAPEDVKFSLRKVGSKIDIDNKEKNFLNNLADKIAKAPDDADGEWFHKVIYDLRDGAEMEPKEMFQTIYKVLINKNSGPRAGWFLATLFNLKSRDWLVETLKQS